MNEDYPLDGKKSIVKQDLGRGRTAEVIEEVVTGMTDRHLRAHFAGYPAIASSNHGSSFRTGLMAPHCQSVVGFGDLLDSAAVGYRIALEQDGGVRLYHTLSSIGLACSSTFPSRWAAVPGLTAA